MTTMSQQYAAKYIRDYTRKNQMNEKKILDLNADVDA